MDTDNGSSNINDYRQAFQLKLNDRLRTIADAKEIMRTAAHVVGEYLGVDHALYNEIINNGETIHIEDGYVPWGTQKITGDFPVSSFGAAMEVLRRGEPLIVEDQTTTPLKDQSARAASTGLGVYASMTVPLVKEGRWVANFGVLQGSPRRWTDHELGILQDAAERTWAAVERARAEETLRENEERFRAFVTASSDVVYRMSPDWSHMNYLQGREFIPDTCSPDSTWLDGYIDPDDQTQVLQVINEAIRTKSIFALEHRVRRVDGTLGWTFSRAVPMLDANGKIKEWFGTASDITRRKETEEALCVSEEKYRTLFNSIDQGFCIIEVLFDDDDHPLDYRFLEVNQAFEGQTGLVDVTGRRMRDMAPRHEQYWFDIYGRIALTGEPARFQDLAQALGYFYDVYAFRVGKPEQRRVGILFNDISALKAAEAALRESEERQGFLLKLSDTLRPISDPEEILAVVAQEAMELFGVDRCYYCEIEDDKAIIRRDASRGDLPSVVGVYPLGSLPIYKSLIEAGQPIVVPDVKTTDLVDGDLRQLCIDLQVISCLDIPVVKEGKPVGILCIVQSSPRDWSELEAEMAKEIAERMWAAVERARAEEALQASEEKYRKIFETAQEGIWVIDGNDKTILVNQKLQNMLGYSLNEIIGRSPQMYMAPEFQVSANERLAEHIEGIMHVMDYRLVKKDGSYLWCILSSTPSFDINGNFDGSIAMITDITERKQLEEEKQVLLNAIQIERDRLSTLINNIPDEIWFLDDRGNIILTNQATKEGFGASFLGINVAEIVAPLEIDRADGRPRPISEAAILRAIKGEKITNVEEIIRTPLNNELRHRWFNAAPVRDRDDNIIGALAVSRDITEQKQAEKEYAMSRLDKISTLYVNDGDLPAILNEVLDLAISFTGADMGNIQLLEAESGLLRITVHRGFEPPFLDFFALVDHGTGSCGTALDRGERVIVEDVTRSPIFVGTPALAVQLEAGVRACQSTPLISRSGAFVGMLNTHFRSPYIPIEQDLQLVDLLAHQAADLIERKKSEESLRQSEERFRKIFNHSPDMITIVQNSDDTYVDVNQRFLDTMGYSREEVIGQTPEALIVRAKGHIETEALLQSLNRHESGDLLEYDLRTKSGRIIAVLASPILMDIDGKSCRVAILKEITELKRYERELARMDRLNLIGEMAAGIGHEIRNPMTTVRGFLQMLGDKPEYADDLVFFELMIEELDRANGIISEFLGLARDKMVDLQPRRLDSVVKSLYPMIRSDANLREIDVKLDLHSAPQVLIDNNEIRQLILNLSRNAMEAMSFHGTLTIGTRRDGDEAVLYIRDEGSGMDPEMVDKLGTPFFTTKDNGTGLGLAICYSIAARHNARIDFETGPEGTTFYVWFPMAVGLAADHMELNGQGG